MCELLTLPGIQPPITANDLEIITKKKFSIEFFPLGVIFNKERESSPVCVVIPAIVNSNRGFNSREKIIDYTHAGIGNIRLALLEAATEMGDSPFFSDRRIDSWGQMVSKHWLSEFDRVERERLKNTHTIYIDEFRQLESAVLDITE